MDQKCVAVKFTENDSARWDGKVADVPRETVVRTGEREADGQERVEVHWPSKGKERGR